MSRFRSVVLSCFVVLAGCASQATLRVGELNERMDNLTGEVQGMVKQIGAINYSKQGISGYEAFLMMLGVGVIIYAVGHKVTSRKKG